MSELDRESNVQNLHILDSGGFNLSCARVQGTPSEVVR